jgi:hypothetical protein
MDGTDDIMLSSKKARYFSIPCGERETETETEREKKIEEEEEKKREGRKEKERQKERKRKKYNLRVEEALLWVGKRREGKRE